MAADRSAAFAIPAAAALLLWPALWNGYPIVFADSGTYLSQAIHHYAGWDRPIFYSLFMLPLHWTVTLWPVLVIQALMTSWVVWLVCRKLLPNVPSLALVGGMAALSTCTWLPWIVSEIMPDLFTPLLVLVICLLAWLPERLSPGQQVMLVILATFMIASQQSSLPLACVLLAILGGISAMARRRVTSGAVRPALTAGRRWLLIILPPVFAVAGLCSVNLVAHGRFAVSPFGNVFLLARVIYDGPGMKILLRDCPAEHWRLCRFVGSFPPTSDDFLWTPDSPLNRAGGPKAVSQDADAIIKAALIAYPASQARAALSNTLEQLTRFNSGDGLNAWPMQVSPWIEHDFPSREYAAYASARQQAGQLSMPPLLAQVHVATSLIGMIACIVLLPLAVGRQAPAVGFLLAVLLAVPVSAAITGMLSAPHDRYQSRIMWLPPFVAAVSAISLARQANTATRDHNALSKPVCMGGDDPSGAI